MGEWVGSARLYLPYRHNKPGRKNGKAGGFSYISYHDLT